MEPMVKPRAKQLSRRLTVEGMSPRRRKNLTVTGEEAQKCVVQNKAAKKELASMAKEFQKLQLPQWMDQEMEYEMGAQVNNQIFSLIMEEGVQQQALKQMVNRENDCLEELEQTTSKIERLELELVELQEAGADRSAEVREEETRESHERIGELEQEMEELGEKFGEARDVIERLQAHWSGEVLQLQKDLLHMDYEKRGERIPPGPFKLRWVDEDWWHLCRFLVLVANGLSVFLAYTHPEGGMLHDYLEGLFLLFYACELGCSLAYFQRVFFRGSWRHVLGNALDLLVVVLGIVQLGAVLLQVKGVVLALLRCLFIFRIVRIMKFVHATFVEDLAWVEGEAFQIFMLLVIVLNCILMGFEINDESWIVWTYLNNCFLIVYAAELWARLRFFGICVFFWGPSWEDLLWNYLDVVIVGISSVCLWIAPLLSELMYLLVGHHLEDDKVKQLMTVLRVVRLARILRLAELVKSIPPLHTLFMGIARALSGMGWVLLLSGTMLYLCALVGMKLVGDGWVLPANGNADQEHARETFASISDAVFNLFKAMNGDLQDFNPLLRTVSASRWPMAAFIILMNWAIFSILTAVVSDNMAAVTQEQEERQERDEVTKRKTEHFSKMERLFQRIDADGSGTIDADEFESLINDEASAEEVSKSTGLPISHLADLFDLVSKRHGPGTAETISHDDFMKLLDTEGGQVTGRCMLLIEKETAFIEHFLQDHGLQPEVIAPHFALTDEAQPQAKLPERER